MTEAEAEAEDDGGVDVVCREAARAALRAYKNIIIRSSHTKLDKNTKKIRWKGIRIFGNKNSQI
jgi:hypothetical protein